MSKESEESRRGDVEKAVSTLPSDMIRIGVDAKGNNIYRDASDASRAATADKAHKLKGSTKHNDEMTMIGYKSIKQTREEAWDKKRKKKYENQK